MPYAKLGKVAKEPEYLEQPNNYNNHDYAVQDAFDLTLHGDEGVHKP
jgi:hypothetical protein